MEIKPHYTLVWTPAWVVLMIPRTHLPNGGEWGKKTVGFFSKPTQCRTGENGRQCGRPNSVSISDHHIGIHKEHSFYEHPKDSFPQNDRNSGGHIKGGAPWLTTPESTRPPHWRCELSIKTGTKQNTRVLLMRSGKAEPSRVITGLRPTLGEGMPHTNAARKDNGETSIIELSLKVGKKPTILIFEVQDTTRNIVKGGGILR